MRWFQDRTTLTKLLLLVVVLSVLTGVVGYQGIHSMASINDMLNTLYEREFTGVSAIKDVGLDLAQTRVYVRQAVLDTEEAAMDRDAEQCEAYFTKMGDTLSKAEKLFVTAEGKAQIARLKEAIPAYHKVVNAALSLTKAARNKEALEVLAKGAAIAEEAAAAVAQASSAKDKLAAQAYADSDVLYGSGRTTMVAITVGAILGGILLGFFIARMISMPLQAMVVLAQKLADGNFNQSLEFHSKDETGKLAEAFRIMIEKLNQALGEVRVSADQVAATAQQLSSASEEISSGAQEQASSLEETSATLEQITATVKQNAENARQANQLALGSRESAEKGGQVVGNAVAAMAEINAASKRIADIITTIDEIAFQTNLLALNAAVEAARAGEQGRGFAVVATEVRNLAQRSATAAKEIKGLIQDSVRKVENGSDLVNRSGQTLSEIVTGVKRVTDIVSEIASASGEQSAGIDQVAKATAQMDQVTQANSAQTEEMSSTAEELSSTAEHMQELVSRFVLNDAIAGHAAAATHRTAKPVAKPPARKPTIKPHISHHDKPSLAALASKTAGGSDDFEEF